MVSYLAAAVVAFSPAAHASTGPAWQTDYGKALEATRRDDRPLLVVLDDPSEKQTRIDADLLTENKDELSAYQLCHVDVSTDYGKRVAKAFGATQFPQTTIIDKKGETVLFKKRGRIGQREWNTALAKFRSGVRSRRIAQTSFFRGNNASQPTMAFPTQGTILSPGYGNAGNCPSCQRNSMNF